MESAESILGKRVLLLDGECALCNSFALFLHPRLQNGVTVHFLGIESKKGKSIVSQFPQAIRDLDSVYFLEGELVFCRSTVIVKCLQLMKMPYRLLGSLIRLVPTRIRDGFYDFTAKRRNRVFGYAERCVWDHWDEKTEIQS